MNKRRLKATLKTTPAYPVYKALRRFAAENTRQLRFTRQKQRKLAEDVYLRYTAGDRKIEDETIAPPSVCYYDRDRAGQYAKMLEEVRIFLKPSERFQVLIDPSFYFVNLRCMTGNIPPNYRMILENSTDALILRYEGMDSALAKDCARILKAVNAYIGRILHEMDRALAGGALTAQQETNLKRQRVFFERISTGAAQTLEEAMQRVLFFSSLFWQSRHTLVGLGRLDLLFEKYEAPKNDEEAIALIEDFYRALHRFYSLKSAVMLGDTGQIIIVGGTREDGSYFANRLTALFIEAMKRAALPDPKLMLRVSEKTPAHLMARALACIATGIGCPILANDDVIIPALEAFGYTHTDACDYAVSACWEPLSYGRSWEQNNIGSLNFARAVVALYQDRKFTEIKDKEELVKLYLRHLETQADNVVCSIKNICWEADPWMSLFTKKCVERGKDITRGGAIYSDFGVTGVGIGSAVDSLINLERFCLDKDAEKISLARMKEAVEKDFEGCEDLRRKLSQSAYFGTDDEQAAALTRRIAQTAAERFDRYTNKFGGKIKFGLSSPNYISEGETTLATFDGRKTGEPLGVHICAPQGTPYTALIGFAGKLDYAGTKSNGNVVDYFVSPDFIKANFDKFAQFITLSVKAGFFEMQMNVVSAATLIAAKAHPEDFPDLIVRVWGFSAYFKDLPVQYQDTLIRRALENEKAA